MAAWRAPRSRADQAAATTREKAYAGAIEYLTDKISLRAEVLLTRGYEDDDAAYVEAAYKITPHWQLAGTFEYLHLKEPPPVDPRRDPGQAPALGRGPQLLGESRTWSSSSTTTASTTTARLVRPTRSTWPWPGRSTKTTNVIIGGIQFAF